MKKISKSDALEIKHESECEKDGFGGRLEFIKFVSWNPSEAVVKVREICNSCGKKLGEEELTYFRED